MKTILFILFAMCLQPVVAKTVECPKASEGKPLAGVGAYFDKQTEIQGVRFGEKGGYRVELPLNVQWLVCEYGAIGGTQRWIEVKPNDSVQRCVLRVREVKSRPQDAKLTCE
ncbi:hypothetical protein [Massilia haematophila]|uniref:Uncharacterized protein n=1 Tax=Massilia haematophila TaxID=457923 RepID=A0ABV7PK33_9BURK